MLGWFGYCRDRPQPPHPPSDILYWRPASRVQFARDCQDRPRCDGHGLAPAEQGRWGSGSQIDKQGPCRHHPVSHNPGRRRFLQQGSHTEGRFSIGIFPVRSVELLVGRQIELDCWNSQPRVVRWSQQWRRWRGRSIFGGSSRLRWNMIQLDMEQFFIPTLLTSSTGVQPTILTTRNC